MPKPSFFPKDLLVEETLQAARRRDQTGTGKSTSAPQRAQTKLAKDETRFKTMLKQRVKKLSKIKYDIGKPCKTIGDVCS